MFHFVAHLMGSHKAHRRIQFDMDLDESIDPCGTGLEIMQASHLRMAHNDLFNPRPIGVR